MSELESLKRQLSGKESELLKLRLELIESKIAALEKKDDDIEGRVRIVETSRVRFETLAWLAFGGGAISLVNILLRLK